MKQGELADGVKTHSKVGEKHLSSISGLISFTPHSVVRVQPLSSLNPLRLFVNFTGKLNEVLTGVLRFFSLRKTLVVEKYNHPDRRMRHPKVDYQELVRRSEEDYVDFQQA